MTKKVKKTASVFNAIKFRNIELVEILKLNITYSICSTEENDWHLKGIHPSVINIKTIYLLIKQRHTLFLSIF